MNLTERLFTELDELGAAHAVVELEETGVALVFSRHEHQQATSLIVTYLDRLQVKKGTAELRLPLTPQAAREVLVQVCHLANAKCAGKLEARLAVHLKGLVQDCTVDVVPVKGDLGMWGPQPALRLPAELAKVPLDDLLTPPEPPAPPPAS